MKGILELSFEELSKVKKFFIFRNIHKISKMTSSFMISVHPYETTWYFGIFTKIC